MKLKQSHLNQIYAMIQERQMEGWYYGNKEQFEKREKEIEEWLKDLTFGKEIKTVVDKQ